MHKTSRRLLTPKKSRLPVLKRKEGFGLMVNTDRRSRSNPGLTWPVISQYANPIPCWQEKAEMCKMLLMLLTQCFVVGLVLWWNSKTFNAMSSILRIYSSIDASLVVSQNDIRWTSRLPLHIPTPFSFWRPWVIAEFVFGRWYKAPPPINHAHPWHRSSALLRPVETHKRFVL